MRFRFENSTTIRALRSMLFRRHPHRDRLISQGPIAVAITILAAGLFPDSPALAADAAAAVEASASPTRASLPDQPGNVGAAATHAKGLRELKLADDFLRAGERESADPKAQERLYRQARAHAETAVELLPNEAEAHFLLFGTTGRLAQLQGLTVAAMQLVSLNNRLDRVLELEPNHANGLAARGGMLVKLPRLLGGDVDEGLGYLERAVKLDPDGVGKRLELAEAYNIAGRRTDALRAAKDGLTVAERRQDQKKIALCRSFQSELEKACDGCSIELIGR